MRIHSRAGAVALGLLSMAALATFAEEPIVVKSQAAVGAAASSGTSSLLVRVFAGKDELKGLAGGAQVYVDRREVGYAPLGPGSIDVGSRVIGVRVEGYRAREFTLTVAKGTDYEVTIPLERAMGYIRVDVKPSDAEILVDGVRHFSRLIEVQAGVRELRVRRFGYREASSQVLVFDRLTTDVHFSLGLAPFEISGFSSSRERFNPANAGPFGNLRLSFDVSSWGSAELTILDPDGKKVFEHAWTSFESWGQSVTWRGQSENGEALPDGSYELRLLARAGGGDRGPGESLPPKEGAPIERSLTVIIDSTMVAQPRGSNEGLPGLAWLPDPSAQPKGLGMIDMSLGWDLARSLPFGAMAGTFSFGDVGIGFLADAYLSAARDAPVRLGLGLLLPLAGTEGFDPGLGFNALVSIAEAGATTLRASGQVPLAFEPGAGTAAALRLRLGLSPGLAVSWTPRQALPGIEAFIGAGASLGTSAWIAGLSARAMATGFEALRPAWGGAVATLEGRALLGEGPLLLIASLSSSIDTSGSIGLPKVSLGLGFWF